MSYLDKCSLFYSIFQDHFDFFSVIFWHSKLNLYSVLESNLMFFRPIESMILSLIVLSKVSKSL